MPWYSFICPRPQPQKQLLPSQQSRERQPKGMFINQSNEIDMPSEYWWITHQRYVQQHWDKALAQVEKINARYFKIHNPQRINLIAEINHLFCENLYSLYLSQNKIMSVEGLIFLNAPLLSDLDLNNNCITSIRCLKKCSFTLDHLFLDNNPLVDFRGLAQIKFNKVLKRNYVTNYYMDAHNSRLQIYNLSEFVRAEPNDIFQSLYIKIAFEHHFPINQLQRQKILTRGL